LLASGRRIAIELEHTEKAVDKYVTTCRWYACATRIDGMRWYVDQEKIGERIRKVIVDNGLENDTDVTIQPFPPGVVVRSFVAPEAAPCRG
jgi:hypothetical protein